MHAQSLDTDIQRLLPISPPGWRGIVAPVRAGGRVAARLCVMHISEITGRIFSVRSSMEVSRPEVVQRDTNLPTMGLPMVQKRVKSGTSWVVGFAERISPKAY